MTREERVKEREKIKEAKSESEFTLCLLINTVTEKPMWWPTRGCNLQELLKTILGQNFVSLAYDNCEIRMLKSQFREKIFVTSH